MVLNAYLPNPIDFGAILEPVNHTPSNRIRSDKLLVLIASSLTRKTLSSRFINIRALNEDHGLNGYEDLQKSA